MATKKILGKTTGATKKTPTAPKSKAALSQAMDSSDPNQLSIVRGTVSYPDKSPAIGLTVTAFDKDIGGEDRLGQATIGATGGYQITYSATQFRRSPNESRGADIFVRIHGANDVLLFQSKTMRNAPADLLLDVKLPAATFVVRGQVRLADGTPVAGALVRVYDKDLRAEEELQGERTSTDKDGRYEIRYSADQFRRDKKLSADLVVKAFAADGLPLATSEVLYNAPPVAEVDLTISAEVLQPPTLFEKIVRELAPLLEGLSVEELEEDKQHQNLSFLSGKTGFEKNLLARFVMAHRLAQHCIQAEFWFALLGGSFFQFVENQSLKDQVAALLDSLSSLDAAAVRKALIRAFNQKEIPEAFRENVDGWVEAFLKFIASHAVRGGDKPTFVKLALEHASIEGAEKQEKFARLFNEHKALTPELLATLEKDKSFKKTEIADLRTSFQLTELTRGDFSVVKMLKEEFDVRQPEKIRTLAKKSASEWVSLVKKKHAAGEIKLPIEVGEIAGQIAFPAAEVYGKTLERQFREAFPTTAFAGGLQRAIQNGGARGLPHAEALGRFLESHEKFEFLNTPVDDFLKNNINPDFRALAENEDFRLEVKAVQRVFKLAPTFEATAAMLADGVHSAQMAYRMGESEFVRSYADRPGFSKESARLAYQRAADTYAAVLTIFGELISLNVEALPKSLQNGNEILKTFPNWNSLFQTGDLCECEHCRSVLGPAAYYADILVFLKDRKARNSASTVKDILFARRPDLGYLELNCDNSLIPLPYIDVVCEVLEEAVDAKHENDLELVGFTAIPLGTDEAAFGANVAALASQMTQAGASATNFTDQLAQAAAALPDGTDLAKFAKAVATIAKKAAAQAGATIAQAAAAVATFVAAYPKAYVAAAFAAKVIRLGADFSLSQVNPLDLDRWVAHGDDVSYLVKKKPPSLNFFAKILPNTKASAAELRAYPQYVNSKTYDTLKTARYPFALPFDLFNEEVRAAFQKINLKRWDLMRTLRGAAAPTNTTDGGVAAEYFGISVGAAGTTQEKQIILSAEVPNQHEYWGETAALLIANVGKVNVFLQKTGLEYPQLLALLDLKFINPNGNIVIVHLDPTCDTDKKVIQVLDAAKLDRIHRFLRLWRKLKDWKMWELDLVIRHPGIGNQNAVGEWLLNEPFLINLFYFSQLRKRLGGKTTVEQVCALFGNLNTQTRFTKLHEKREDALYQNLFLNKRLINPLDPAFNHAPGTGDLLPGKTISAPSHSSAVLAALGIRESDLVLLKDLTKASDGTPYITDDLNLANLSFLWRHAWLSKILKFKAEEWQVLLKTFHQDLVQFASPKAAWEFIEKIDHVKAAGFTPDELNWLLAVDRSAKAATKETDAARFLAGLRKELQAIKAEYNPVQPLYAFLSPPSDLDNLTTLLSSLQQKLNREEPEVNAFLKSLRGPVLLEADVQGLGASFTFPNTITGAANNIPIRHERVLRFSGVMTDTQRTVLLSGALPAAVTGNSSYISAIGELFQQSGQATVTGLLSGFTFPPAITGGLNNIPIRYESVLRFDGAMTGAQRTILLALPVAATEKIAYENAIEDLYQQSLEAATNHTISEVKVPAGMTLTLPSNLPSIPIRYDVNTQTLSFIGVMTTTEQTALINAGTAAASAAIVELFRLPRLAVKFFELVFTAPLVTLPPVVDFKVQLPANLAAKIIFDAEQRLLRFTDIMSNAEKAQILALSGDAAYIAAVNSLAAQPQTIASTDARVWLSDADLDVTKPDNDTFAKRLANAAKKALNYLSKTFTTNAVVQQSSAQLGLSEALTRRLLTAYAVVPILPPPAPPSKATLMAHLLSNFTIDSTTFDGWYWAIRVATILKKWKITLEELDKLIGLTAGAQLLDFKTLPINDAPLVVPPIETFLRTHRLLKLRDSLPETKTTLLEVLEKLNAKIPATITDLADSDFPADVERLSDAWIEADVKALIKSLDITNPADYLRVEIWERLSLAFSFLDHLNASADTVIKFAVPAMTDVHARRIKELLRSKFGAETWLALATEIQDVLRERKRDALAAYLLSQSKPGDAPSDKWENTNDLYAYYLLDVEMSSCQLTSRLVQASGSVQLFVQRCFMGLEPDVVVQADGGDIAWRWWAWMRKYRVWEANRKVFLWPENYIEPELKKDKSPFFKDMENELLQNEVNQYTVETAFSNYLEKLDGVAQLEIAGFFQEDDGENAIVHVFGRTAKAEPHLYYYRRYDYWQWTPWEKVELDIQGDYLIPAVVNKRLFLFWPVFTEVPDEMGNNTISVPQPGQKIFTPDKTQKKLRLQMAVSDYRQGKWTPKKVSKDFDESKSYTIENIRKNYQFFPIDRSNEDGRFVIQYDGRSVDMAAIEASLAAAQAVANANKESAVADVGIAQKAAGDAADDAKYAADAFKLVDNYVTLADNLAAFIDNDSDPINHRGIDKVNYAQGAVNDVAAIDSVAPGSLAALFGLDAGFVGDAADFKRLVNWTHGQSMAANDPNNPDRAKAAGWAKDRAHTAQDLAKALLKTAQAVRDAIADDARAAARDLRTANTKLSAAQKAVTDLSQPNSTSFIMAAVADAKNASLSGAFDISGCTGAPEKTNPVGIFTSAIQPEKASVGDAPAFLKWVERTPNPKSNPIVPEHDFTLATSFPAPYTTITTKVLKKTPGIFKMSPAWNLSKRDKACRVADTTHSRVGSFLPFFYNDKQRTFFVLPSLLIPNQGYSSYPELEKYLSGYDIWDPIGIWKDYLISQRFHFTNFYHPFVYKFAELVYNPLKGIPALMSRETQLNEPRDTKFSFEADYGPDLAVVKLPPQYPLLPDCYPREVVDFTPDGAYAPYNWELFFHAPLMIANQLSKNQRFEEAREWYHFIFNPIGVDGPVPLLPGDSPMRKYWITKPFFETTDPQYVQQRIDNIMLMLAIDKGRPDQPLTDLEMQVKDWRINPFEPHRIANYRTVAYQKTVVMKYLNNLIAWGDNLFRQESMESTNEATQLYVLAAEILGPRPKRIPPRVKPSVESFNELEEQFDKFANALVGLENFVPVMPSYSLKSFDDRNRNDSNRPQLPTLYFCIPQNDKMLGYWDTVADRLYKIRHCMNIEGVVRQLALFEPPIDPAALVKAIAGGVDISSALADLNAPLPLYRFNVLLQKANEVCNDVKALGGALLAALEKKDAEAMGLLRQSQEIKLLDAVKTVREKQIDEAKETWEGLKRSKSTVEERRNFYRDIENVNTWEAMSMTTHGLGIVSEAVATIMNGVAGVAHLVPEITIGVSGIGGSPQTVVKYGGGNVGSSAFNWAAFFSGLGGILHSGANLMATQGSNERRWADWKLQERLAEKELDQMDKQIASAELRIAIAEKELDNHALQIENAKATDTFLRSKYTNQDLYQWQVGQISGVYFQSYKLAYDFAKRAERCLRFELGLQDSSYINFGYWDSLKKGLLSGEKLQYDLRRLETAYLEQSRREFELTKHVSLALRDPLALVRLRETGRCFFRLPEEIFDLDYPGHYFRRIKSVSMTLPCVVGPYTTISCTLRLLKNSIRVNTKMVDRYPRNTVDDLPADDDRFIGNNIPVKAIAASNAQNDSGVFELSFRDERYLPFEGAGAVSEWSLELFSDPTKPDFGKPLRQFDYSTISDAVLHVKYTAREDAGAFKNEAIEHLRTHLEEDGKTPSLRMFDLRREFPSQWARFLHPTNPANGNVLEIEMSRDIFRMLDDGKTVKVNSITLLARCSNAGTYSMRLSPPLPAPPPAGTDVMTLTRATQYGGLHFSQKAVDALAIPLLPTGLPVTWQLKMTRPGGGDLQIDPVTNVMEVEDVLLVLGYEWE